MNALTAEAAALKEALAEEEALPSALPLAERDPEGLPLLLRLTLPTGEVVGPSTVVVGSEVAGAEKVALGEGAPLLRGDRLALTLPLEEMLGLAIARVLLAVKEMVGVPLEQCVAKGGAVE